MQQTFCRNLAKHFGIALILTLAVALSSQQISAQTFTVTPSSVAFKQVVDGTIGLAYTVTVTNTGKTGNVVIDSYSLEPSEFQFFYGWSPVVLTPNTLINYSIRFAPDAPQTFNGTFTINIEGAQPVVVPLTGTGVSTGANPTISVPSLTFANTPAGTVSASQPITITNNGYDWHYGEHDYSGPTVPVGWI